MGLFEALARAYELRDMQERTSLARAAQQSAAAAEAALADYRNRALSEQSRQFDVSSDRATRALDIQERHGDANIAHEGTRLSILGRQVDEAVRHNMASESISRGHLGVSQGQLAIAQRNQAVQDAVRFALGGGGLPPHLAGALSPETLALIGTIPPPQRAALLAGAGSLTPAGQIEQMIAERTAAGAAPDDPELQRLLEIRGSVAERAFQGRATGSALESLLMGSEPAAGAPVPGGAPGADIGLSADPLMGMEPKAFADQFIAELQQAAAAGVSPDLVRHGQAAQALAALASRDLQQARRVGAAAIDLGFVSQEELAVPPASVAAPNAPRATPAAPPLAAGTTIPIPPGAYALPPSGVAPPPTAHMVPRPDEAFDWALSGVRAVPEVGLSALHKIWSGQTRDLNEAIRRSVEERFAGSRTRARSEQAGLR